MTTKTPAQIAEEAARAYLTANCIKREAGETARTTFGWNLGDHAGYEETLEKFAGHVLEVERARRSTGVEYWARDVADAMYEDKSNDWTEELAELRAILDEPNGWLDA